MIKQAIIPLAGLGTRMLPLTSVMPKELLPINGKPNVEYILEEAIDAGIKEFIFIISNHYSILFIIIKLIEPVVERQISKIFSDKKISNKIMKELVNSTDEFTPEKKEFYIDIIKKIYIKWMPLFDEAQNQAHKEMNLK